MTDSPFRLNFDGLVYCYTIIAAACNLIQNWSQLVAQGYTN